MSRKAEWRRSFSMEEMRNSAAMVFIGPIELAQCGLDRRTQGGVLGRAGERLLKAGADIGDRRAQVVRDIVADAGQLPQKALDFIEHQVDRDDHAIEFVDPRTHGQTGAEIALHDGGDGAVDLANALAAAPGQEKAGGERAGGKGQDGEGKGAGEDMPQEDHFLQAASQHDDAAVGAGVGDQQGRLRLTPGRGAEIVDHMRLPIDRDIGTPVEVAENQRALGIVEGDKIQPAEIARQAQRQGATEPVVAGRRRLFRLIGEDLPQLADPGVGRRDIDETENAPGEQENGQRESPRQTQGRRAEQVTRPHRAKTPRRAD